MAGGDNDKSDWKKILRYIKERRTHEEAFQLLVKRCLENKDFAYRSELQTITMLYDFSPIRVDHND